MVDEEPRHNLLDPGEVVDGRYRVSRFLGEGGFAEVYEAEHVHIERRVALKLLKVPGRGAQRQLVRERFKREAALAARIDHPGVATVYDFGFVAPDGAPYIAMELLSGVDVGEELERGGGMAPERALRLFRQALEALAAAHALGVVHKDLKPSNLFLVRPGAPNESLRLLDFGIARLMERGHTLTQTGGMAGTPQYMAPEYIEASVVSGATDVYQMGLILVELLTGEVVVKGNNVMHCLVLHSDGNLDVPPPLLASPLGPILRTATARDPVARYADASAFLAALAGLDASAIPDVRGGLRSARAGDTASSAPDLALGPTEDDLPSRTATAGLDPLEATLPDAPSAPLAPASSASAPESSVPAGLDGAPVDVASPIPVPAIPPTRPTATDASPPPSIVVAPGGRRAGLLILGALAVAALLGLGWGLGHPSTDLPAPRVPADAIPAAASPDAGPADAASTELPAAAADAAPTEPPALEPDAPESPTPDASSTPDASPTPAARRRARADRAALAATPPPHDSAVADQPPPHDASAPVDPATEPKPPADAPASQPVRKRVGKLN